MNMRQSPTRSEDGLVKAIEHIWDGLRWMTRAARRFRDVCGKDSDEVAFLDSALIHARSFIEFFAGRSQKKFDIKLNDFGGWVPSGLAKEAWDWANQWLDPIDKRLAHLSSRRDSPPLPPVPQPKDGTNWGVHELTCALLVTWDGFAAHLRNKNKKSLADSLQSKIDQAYTEWGCTRANAIEVVKNRAKTP